MASTGRLQRIMKDVLGSSDDSEILSLLQRGLNRQYDMKKFKDRLSSHIKDNTKASRLAAKVIEEVEHSKNGSSNRKRPKFEEYPSIPGMNEHNGEVDAKKPKKSDDVVVISDSAINSSNPKHTITTTTSAMDNLKIKEIMAKAQLMIEERKKKLHLPTTVPSSVKLKPDEAEEFMQQALEKAKKAAELKARIADRLPAALGNSKVGTTIELAGAKPAPLILDSSGRPVDATGRQVQLTQRTPTLKANLRQEKRELFRRAHIEPDIPESFFVEKTGDDEAQTYIDPRVNLKLPARSRRQFKFHEKGEFETLANRQRAKAKLEKLQSDISQIAKKTGISSAVKLAMVAPKATDSVDVEVPSLEWWDSVIVPDDVNSYETVDERQLVGEGMNEIKFDSSAISNLVEHPIQLRAPSDPLQPQYLKVFLTKREMKKLRRQNRKEMQREKTEKIRLGLEPPPEPKVKISNLMRVLGSDAIQDPTKMEAHVREQMARRLKRHEEANLSRKLTPVQKAAKKAKKLHEDVSTGVLVAVYRVTDLSDPGKKFKVEMNAKQLYLTGTIVLHKDVNVVVVEGGQKQQKFFKNLMLRRIKWAVDHTTTSSAAGERKSTVMFASGNREEQNQEQVVSVLGGPTVEFLEKEVLEKQTSIKLKNLLISEALDVLSCQRSISVTFGWNFEAVATSACEDNVSLGQTKGRSNVVERNVEVSVVNSWEIVVRDYLCVGLEVENVSENRPKCRAICMVRIPLPGPTKFSLLVSWASQSGDFDTSGARRNFCFNTCLDSGTWKTEQFVLHSVDFNPLLHGLKSIQLLSDLFHDPSWYNVCAVHCCQTEKNFTSDLDYYSFRIKIGELSKFLKFEEIFRGYFLWVGSAGFSGVVLYFREEQRIVSVHAWNESEICVFVGLLLSNGWKLEVLFPSENNWSVKKLEQRKQLFEATLNELKLFTEERTWNLQSADPVKVPGEVCRNLNQKVLLECLD